MICCCSAPHKEDRGEEGVATSAGRVVMKRHRMEECVDVKIPSISADLKASLGIY